MARLCTVTQKRELMASVGAGSTDRLMEQATDRAGAGAEVQRHRLQVGPICMTHATNTV
jgi:hypothetical protein